MSSVDVAFFLVFHCYESGEILPVQFLHHFGNFRDSFSQQHIHFAVNGLNVFKVYKFQTRAQFAKSVHRIMPAGGEVSHIGGRADGFGKSVQRVQHIFRTLIGEFLALEIVVVNSEGQLLLGKRRSIRFRMLPVASPVILRAPRILAKRTALSRSASSLMVAE